MADVKLDMQTKAVLMAVHEVLKGLTVSIAAAARVDKAELSHLLSAFAANPKLEPLAQKMLADLAEGVQALDLRRPQ